MRKIKSRGYNPNLINKWVYGIQNESLLRLPLNTYYLSDFWKLIEQGSFRYAGDYTGLKDKNGKEIYEEDLIINSMRNNGKPHPVEWDNAQGGWVGNYRLRYLLGQENNELEVIGNIYENPELLKGER
jgi:hypothetical protein